MWLVIIFIVIGLAVGGFVGGYFAWKNKKALEKSEEPLQAEKTEKQKETTDKKNGKKVESPIEVKDWENYENKEYNYKIKYPRGWYKTEEGTWLTTFTNYNSKDVVGDSLPGVMIEVLVQGNPKNLNLKDWVEEGHQYSGNPTSSRELKISNLDAIWEELYFAGPTTNVTIMRANDVFTVSFTGRSTDYQKYGKAFEEVIKDLEIGGYY